MIYENSTLQKIIAFLGLRFPVAEFSRELGYSKSAVSNYINGNKPLSESFVRALEKRYKLKFEDFVGEKIMQKIPALKPDNIQEVAVFVAENQDALMKDPLFRTVIESLFLKSEIQDLKRND